MQQETGSAARDDTLQSGSSERAVDLLFFGSCTVALLRVLQSVFSDSGDPGFITDVTVGGDIVLVALLVVAGVVVIFDVRGDATNRRISAATITYFAGGVVAGAIGLARAGFSVDEVTWLIFGSVLGRGGLTVGLVLLSLRLRPHTNRLPTVPVAGLIALGVSSGFTTAWDAVAFGSFSEALQFALSLAGGWPLIAAAALVLLCRANVELAQLLRRSAWVVAGLVAVVLVLSLATPSNDTRFSGDLSNVIQASALTSLGMLTIVLAAAYLAAGRVDSTALASDRYQAMGITTALLLFFWPTAIVALNYSARAQAAAEQGDLELAKGMSQSALAWRIISALLAAVVVAFLVWISN